jgi:hypothetical protein
MLSREEVQKLERESRGLHNRMKARYGVDVPLLEIEPLD